MAHFDEKSLKIILEDEDKKALNNKESIADNIMNWIIWGQTHDPFDALKNHDKKQKNEASHYKSNEIND